MPARSPNDIDKSRTTCYRPSTNGQVEQFDRTIMDAHMTRAIIDNQEPRNISTLEASDESDVDTTNYADICQGRVRSMVSKNIDTSDDNDSNNEDDQIHGRSLSEDENHVHNVTSAGVHEQGDCDPDRLAALSKELHAIFALREPMRNKRISRSAAARRNESMPRQYAAASRISLRNFASVRRGMPRSAT
ncbi:hypothetical protein DPMN_011306 [Dreissena polymorpha]|uniref:Uncharacterized protein n=1 Tax=Dreissena polymorpha TaxID=45954 RepID=A0A9D4N3T2_DREPO|nr:hypothetical protein DPMN_011306 [Dreissena polymorpha]